MSLKDDLKTSLVEAAKARDQVRLDTVRSVQSAIRYKEIEKKSELNEAEIVAVIRTLCKQRREAIDQFQKGGRAELVQKESRELEILEKYLPPQMSREEIEKVVKQTIETLSAPSEKGLVMKAVMKQLSGKADGRVVQEVVQSLLKS